MDGIYAVVHRTGNQIALNWVALPIHALDLHLQLWVTGDCRGPFCQWIHIKNDDSESRQT